MKTHDESLLKTERYLDANFVGTGGCLNDANFVATGGARVCHNDIEVCSYWWKLPSREPQPAAPVAAMYR